jgi:hypothetical protein
MYLLKGDRLAKSTGRRTLAAENSVYGVLMVLPVTKEHSIRFMSVLPSSGTAYGLGAGGSLLLC